MKVTILSMSFAMAFVTLHAQSQQTLHVRLIDGHNGQPVAGRAVSLVVVSPKYGIVYASQRGDAYTIVVENGMTLRLGNVQMASEAWNQWLPCSKNNMKDPPIFSVADIESKGIVSPNKCNKRITVPKQPGVLTIFIRPLTWWEKFTGMLSV